MRKAISLFVKYPFYANIIIAVLLIGGVVSILNMKYSFFPERTSREITISVVYPGASPKEMEEGITARLEEAVRGIVGIKEINSTSSENFAIVRITTTGEYNLDETLQDVKNSIDGISSYPVDAERPVVFKGRSLTMALYMGLIGDVDLLTLKTIASTIEDELMNSGIVSQVSLSGYPPLELSVEVPEETLLRYNLTFDEIVRAISSNNRDISAGMIRSDREEVLIRLRSRSVDPDVISDIIIKANDDGSYLRIRDVGKVFLQFADVSGSSYMNGKRSISIRVMKLPEEDLAEISTFLEDYVEDFNNTHDVVSLHITYNFMEMLQARLQLLYSNGGIGLLLVLVALGLFLSLRLSFWVAWGIPASFLAMFIAANLYGITINMMSVFGMILVIGILVDDGIVIAENIYTHFENGKSPARAAVDGTMEVMPAVLTSVATTVIAFSPLLFLKKGRMEFLYEMAFVVIASLIFSLFEAFFVLPGHVGNKFILRPKTGTSIGAKIRRTLDRFVNFMKLRIYGALLVRIIRWKWVMVAFPVFLIMVTVGLFGGGIIKSTFFPAIPFDQFTVDIAFTPGTGEQTTLEHLNNIDESIWQVDRELMVEYQDTVHYINYTFVSTGGAFSGQETGAHAGNIFVLLRNLEGAAVTSYDIVQKVREKVGEIPEAEKFTIAGRNTFGRPVSHSLLGKNLAELSSARDFLIEGMEKIPQLNNISDNNALGKREIRLELKPKAYFLGLNQASISNQVRQGFFGGQAQRLQKGKDELRVWVRYPKTDRMNLGQLESMTIKTPRGEFPLAELATYKIERGPVNIQRFNGSREIRVFADLVDPLEPVPPILENIKQNILPQLQAKYPGVRIEYQGQRRASDEATGEMMSYFQIAFFLIILVITIHFRSFTQALIILLMIPLGWLGSIWGHGIENLPVSMLSAWGMVALTGVIINDAVIFLQKYNSNLLENMSVKEAVYNAGLARFRPIILTTLTTTIGLYPIILEKSFQAQFLKPMAVALAYGILFGTAFILIFFPAIILVLNDLKVKAIWVFTGKHVSNESVETAVKNSKKRIE